MRDTSTDWIAALRGPQQWKADDAARVLAAWAQSDESMSRFATRHGINPQRIAWWRARIGASSSMTSALTLVPLTVRPAATTAAAAVSIVVDAIRVDVDPQHVSPQWIAAVVDALAATRRA